MTPLAALGTYIQSEFQINAFLWLQCKVDRAVADLEHRAFDSLAFDPLHFCWTVMFLCTRSTLK
jgi:hypothetical protein